MKLLLEEIRNAEVCCEEMGRDFRASRQLTTCALGRLRSRLATRVKAAVGWSLQWPVRKSQCRYQLRLAHAPVDQRGRKTAPSLPNWGASCLTPPPERRPSCWWKAVRTTTPTRWGNRSTVWRWPSCSDCIKTPPAPLRVTPQGGGTGRLAGQPVGASRLGCFRRLGRAPVPRVAGGHLLPSTGCLFPPFPLPRSRPCRPA